MVFCNIWSFFLRFQSSLFVQNDICLVRRISSESAVGVTELRIWSIGIALFLVRAVSGGGGGESECAGHPPLIETSHHASRWTGKPPLHPSTNQNTVP